MHGDRNKSDGLCGSTRRSLSGQLNIWMHVCCLKWSSKRHKCFILFKFCFSKQTQYLKSHFGTRFRTCMQDCSFLGTNYNNCRFPFVAVISIYKSIRLSSICCPIIYTFLPIQVLSAVVILLNWLWNFYIVFHTTFTDMRWNQAACHLQNVKPWCALIECLPTVFDMIKYDIQYVSTDHSWRRGTFNSRKGRK